MVRGRPRKTKEDTVPNFRKYLKKEVDIKVRLVPDLRINRLIGNALKECGVPIINERMLSDTGTLYINHTNLPGGRYSGYYSIYNDKFDSAPGIEYDLHTDSLTGAKKGRPRKIKEPVRLEEPVKKKYKGKVTKHVLSQIQSALTDAAVDKARKKLAAEVYQHLIETSEEFRIRMAVATDPVYGEYAAMTHDVYVRGVATYSSGEKYDSTETVRLAAAYALHKHSSFNLVHQEFFERARALDKRKREIYQLFNGGRLRHFLNKSLRGFFEAFPELEPYYKYVEPIPVMRAGRAPVPSGLVASIKGDLDRYLSLAQEERNEEK